MWYEGTDDKGCKVEVSIHYPNDGDKLYTIRITRDIKGIGWNAGHCTMKIHEDFDSPNIISLLVVKAPLYVLADAIDEDDNLKTCDGLNKSWMTMQLRKSCLVVKYDNRKISIDRKSIKDPKASTELRKMFR